jgi:hypothetical protein
MLNCLFGRNDSVLTEKTFYNPDFKCMICFYQIKPVEKIITLCNVNQHVYHAQCIKKYSKDTCIWCYNAEILVESTNV